MKKSKLLKWFENVIFSLMKGMDFILKKSDYEKEIFVRNIFIIVLVICNILQFLF